MVDVGSLLKNWRVQLLLAAIILSIAFIAVKGITTGIEFQGGVRIPISLEKAVDAETMDQMVETIKLRVNKYGLSQSVVRPLGDKEVIVEIPRANPEVLQSVQRVLREQGHFEAIIDGKVALEGSDILPGAVGGPQGERVFANLDGAYSWELDFAANSQGALRFSKSALGKAEFPVFMFLDRPRNAAIVLNRNQLGLSGSSVFGSSSAEDAAIEALRSENGNLELIFAEDLETTAGQSKLASMVSAGNISKIIIGENLKQNNSKAFAAITATGTKVSEVPLEDLVPIIDVQTRSAFSQGRTFVSRWKAIGLLSGPLLSGDLADGRINQFYRVTGTAGGTTAVDQQKNAAKELKELKSVVSGGRLPVNVVIGSSFTVEPTLGAKFLEYSWIALILSIIAVSILIMARYGSPLLVFPIVLVSCAEILITMTLISGIGTLDLGAMAGLITLMGAGVSDQIIISDELKRRRNENEAFIKSDERDTRDRISKGFTIIWLNVFVAIAAMLPLLFSGMIEIMGFAMSVVFGILVGVLITRPAFALIAAEVIGKKQAPQ